jgi:uncharacterized protein
MSGPIGTANVARDPPHRPHPMILRPLRLAPGSDLRRALDEYLKVSELHSAFVVSGIGSLVRANLRFAGEAGEALVSGPLELLSLAGTLTESGSHLHLSVSNSSGGVIGGHACFGCEIRTTAEILLAGLADWRMAREHDEATGYRELVIRPLN